MTFGLKTSRLRTPVWAYPYGSGYPLIRLQALRHGPVSATIPYANLSESEFTELMNELNFVCNRNLKN